MKYVNSFFLSPVETIGKTYDFSDYKKDKNVWLIWFFAYVEYKNDAR